MTDNVETDPRNKDEIITEQLECIRILKERNRELETLLTYTRGTIRDVLQELSVL